MSWSSAPIAIVGMDGIFPDAQGTDTLWRNIVAGRDAARDVPASRWILPAAEVVDGTAIPAAPDRALSRRACLVADDIALDLAGLDASTANTLDPTLTWALHAGQGAFRQGQMEAIARQRIGVILAAIALPTEGACTLARQLVGGAFEARVLKHHHASPQLTLSARVNAQVTGLPASLLAQSLGLGGGCLTLDAACASSLYALKLACDALQAGKADAMLAGGVSRPDSLYTQIGFSQLQALSPSGRCAPFDASADGLVVGEGAGIFLLKRLPDALAHGDTILGVIRGIGLSNDLRGALLAPACEGQLRAMQIAYKQAGWSPSDVDMIECHGTGTRLGDQREVESLCRLWQTVSSTPEQCVIGSVKSNVGHLLTAAAAAGTIKTLLAMKHATLPPTAHFQTPPTVSLLPDSPFRVLSSPVSWECRAPGVPRRAAVSAFGFGGINAHLLLEEWDPELASRGEGFQSTDLPPIAIVGMGAHVGRASTLGTFLEAVFRGEDLLQPRPEGRWYGYAPADFGIDEPCGERGGYIEKIDVPVGRYPLPPNEIGQTLPQQLLMLEVADAAMNAAGLDTAASHPEMGAIIGIQFDQEATHFHLRWAIPQLAKGWAEQLGLALDDDELAVWVASLREAMGPPLNGPRTVGALGGIVASRVAKSFGLGGPCFVVSSQENAGLCALELAANALQRGEVDTMLVGAVDLAGDIRQMMSFPQMNAHANKDEGQSTGEGDNTPRLGEGAGAIVLQRYADAKARDASIVAIVRGIGRVSGGALLATCPPKETAIAAMTQAYAAAGIQPHEISLVEAQCAGGWLQDTDELATLEGFFAGSSQSKALGATIPHTGHTHGLAGLLSVIKASACLQYRTLPPYIGFQGRDAMTSEATSVFHLPQAAQLWTRERSDGPRMAAVHSPGSDGQCVHVVLAEDPRRQVAEQVAEHRSPDTSDDAGLEIDKEVDDKALLYGLEALHRHSQEGGPLQNKQAGLGKGSAAASSGSTPVSIPVVLGGVASMVPGVPLPKAQQSLAWMHHAMPVSMQPASLAQVSRSLTSPMDGPMGDLMGDLMGRMIANPPPHGQDRDRMSLLSMPPGAGLPVAHGWHTLSPTVVSFLENARQTASAHDSYLRLTAQSTQDLVAAYQAQSELLASMISGALDAGLMPQNGSGELQRAVASPLDTLTSMSGGAMAGHLASDAVPQVAYDREMCLEFAIGSLEKVLGPMFAAVDTYPVRVRLPDQPLMLVDRILSVDGELGSMTSGSLVTEHDVLPGAWYLDGDRAPVCVSVEAGQADLFLCSYLGVDLVVKGKRAYRLLDAEIHFHRGLPRVGEVIRYDITIDKFVRQGDVVLFFFQFDGAINGEPVLTMRNGCAGFFTPEEVEASGGIIFKEEERRPQPGKLPPGYRPLLEVPATSYDEAAIACLRRGDLGGCFGPAFAGLPLAQPATLPAGKLQLLHRVLSLSPGGGRFGLGSIQAAADIHPDDWFLTCHFVDDMVMPGTLMYECCAHTLRVLLMRMGWVGEAGQVAYEPVPGIKSALRCRGPVTPQTREVIYDVEIKEIGTHPHPYVIADALMTADGKRVVFFKDMSMQMTGGDYQALQAMWSAQAPVSVSFAAQPPDGTPQPAIYDRESILAYAIGKPSEAFGAQYQCFDTERVIARLPGPPYLFLDRITAIEPEPWVLEAGGWIEGEYEVPPDAWYFAANQQASMPFAVLLEIVLQPCGWLAAYLGSALRSQEDISFRNLGGEAILHEVIPPDAGLLTTRVRMTSVAQAGGMIIEKFDLQLWRQGRCIYKGKTEFGFFTKASLRQQVGIIGAAERAYHPIDTASQAIPLPALAPLYPGHQETHQVDTGLCMPAKALCMIDQIELFVPDGGPHGLGFVRGSKMVDPEEWFFAAHFYQDPVCPGSLGLESLLQLLKYTAIARWGESHGATHTFAPILLGETHRWVYRGQIPPTAHRVEVDAVITEIRESPMPVLKAHGFLKVDGKYMYEMIDFGIQLLAIDRRSTKKMPES